MLVYIENVIEQIVQIMQHSGPILGFLIIVLESIIPFLPLAAFIALNIMSFGPVGGFILSWLATITGCILSYYICRKGISGFFHRKIKIDGKVHKFMHYMKNIRFSQLVVITAIPFAPAFAINIAAGLSKMPFKKFLLAVTVGKLSIIYFWSYIGTSFIESIKNPYILVEMGVIMTLVYVISWLIQKKIKISQE